MHNKFTRVNILPNILSMPQSFYENFSRLCLLSRYKASHRNQGPCEVTTNNPIARPRLGLSLFILLTAASFRDFHKHGNYPSLSKSPLSLIIIITSRQGRHHHRSWVEPQTGDWPSGHQSPLQSHHGNGFPAWPGAGAWLPVSGHSAVVILINRGLKCTGKCMKWNRNI